MIRYLDLDSSLGHVGAEFVDNDCRGPKHSTGEEVVQHLCVLVLLIPKLFRTNLSNLHIFLLMLLTGAFFPPRGGSVDEDFVGDALVEVIGGSFCCEMNGINTPRSSVARVEITPYFFGAFCVSRWDDDGSFTFFLIFIFILAVATFPLALPHDHLLTTASFLLTVAIAVLALALLPIPFFLLAVTVTVAVAALVLLGLVLGLFLNKSSINNEFMKLERAYVGGRV